MNAVTQRSASRGLATPTNMTDAMRLAEMLAQSTMVPQSYRGKPGDVLVAVQMGAELGLSPLQALQNIASINGRPSVWGDAALALAQAHPLYVSHREWIEGEGDEMAGCCEVTRRGSSPHVARFSVRQARKANLWNKAGPWQQYPERMLVLRARGFALRDKFADALRGLITAEEAQDMPADAVQVVGVAVPDQPALAAPAVMAMQPSEDPLPIYAPDGALHQIGAGAGQPAVMRWMSAARKAIAKLESIEAVREWKDAMDPHFDQIAEKEPEAVDAVRAAIEARLVALVPAEAIISKEHGDQ